VGGDFDWNLAWNDYAMGRDPGAPLELRDWDNELEEYARRVQSLAKSEPDWDVAWRKERVHRRWLHPVFWKTGVNWDAEWVRHHKRVQSERLQRVIEPGRPARKLPEGREPVRGVERFIEEVYETATAHRIAEDMWWLSVLDFYRVAAAGFVIALCLIALCRGIALRGLPLARRFFFARSETGSIAALAWFALFGGETFSRTAPHWRRHWWQKINWRSYPRRITAAVIKSDQRAQQRLRFITEGRSDLNGLNSWVEP
jgi:hypothetical protein